jgi:hypothetical protein
VKKEQNGRKSLRRLKPTVGCNANKRRRCGWEDNINIDLKNVMGGCRMV